MSRIKGLVWLVCIFASMACTLLGDWGQDTSGQELAFKPAKLPEAQKGRAFEAKITVERSRTPVGAFSIAEGKLPAGLTLKKVDEVENTAVISGTPTEAGNYPIVIEIWCYGTNRPGQTGRMEYTLTVKE